MLFESQLALPMQNERKKEFKLNKKFRRIDSEKNIELNAITKKKTNL